jgi:lon-related putative ATP-dependent protease
MIPRSLSISELYRKTDPDSIKAETTDDLHDLTGPIGQPRAVQAVRFGIGINRDGYNIYALGPSGLGKRTLIKQSFEQKAAEMPAPLDWAYVYNFKDRHKPDAISLPAGKGVIFCKDMDRLVDELRISLKAAFDSDEYRARKQVIDQEFEERQEKAFEDLQEQARQRNYSVLRTPGGLMFAPIRNGEVVAPEAFQTLPEEERKIIESNMQVLQAELQKILQQVPSIQREMRERMRDLNRSMINFAVGSLIKDIKAKYTGDVDVVSYLDAVEEDVIENAKDFLPQEDEQTEAASSVASIMGRSQEGQISPLRRYKVNLIVDHSQAKGAPVIYEDNPTYSNLIGQVEQVAQMGALFTDFTLIKPGSLHKANGGFLILDARKMLSQPYAWDALKRALQSGRVIIESLGQMLNLISTTSIQPEPIPLNVKIALIGDRQLYYLLSAADPDFNELFRVQADFEEQIKREDGNQELYARLVASIAHEDKLRPFDRGAIARVLEHSARLAEDASRLSMNMGTIATLMREADYWAGESQSDLVRVDDVQKAVDQQIYRADLIRERDQETILRNIYLIDTDGEKVGQINGLSVLQLGNFSFGRPTCISARTWIGKGDVVNIDREVDLSGPIHSKGVLILAGFLGARYAQERPLALSASLVFEQSYGGVEGDSASSAELYALLSSIAGVPIKQSLAVTGAVNQHGQVEAIGGVNEKIEGFFNICKQRGLTGKQGVLIPASNVTNLMLRADVVKAVEDGQFAIYPVETIDQGIELLTGMPAGVPGPDGVFPSDTFNGKVQNRLEEMGRKQSEAEPGHLAEKGVKRERK